MSALQGNVGARNIHWKKAPMGSTGSGEVEVDGKSYAVSWRKDPDGLWIEFAHACRGFDVLAEKDDSGALNYTLTERGSDRVFRGIRFRAAGEKSVEQSGEGRRKATRIRAKMPGKIVRLLVASGDDVVKDQALLVMEAMKMENEIRAPGAGKIGTVHVSVGQAVETGADLMTIGSE